MRSNPELNEVNVRKPKRFMFNEFKIKGNFPAIYFATAEDRNQNPIIKEANFFGDTLVTIDRPIGDKHSSPNV